MRLVNGRDIVARAYGWSRLGFVNKKLKHHAEATHLNWRSKTTSKRRKSRHWLYTACNRMTWSEVRHIVASGLLHLPGRAWGLLDIFSFHIFDHHLMEAYGAHDLEEVQADHLLWVHL